MSKHSEQLGMANGTAFGRLRKNIMFSLVQRCNLDVCHQCNTKIESSEEMSIEHKVPWLDSANPTDLFFDLDNIAFSHLKCNVKAARVTPSKINAGKRAGLANRNKSMLKRVRTVDGYIHCSSCNDYVPPQEFTIGTNKTKEFNYYYICNPCRRERRRK